MTQVKICGIRTEAALDAALEAGADYAGLVFFAKSPRNADIVTAAKLARRAHESSRVKVVALLVDADDGLIASVVDHVAPDVLQLHGHESVARVEEVAGQARRLVWKAVPVATTADVAASEAYLGPGRADMLLYDAKPPADPRALPGGNGLSFDWRILGPGTRRPFVLAGGLTPENVAEAVRLVAPAVVDVSSGVEAKPGEKSPELIRRFIRAAKGGKG